MEREALKLALEALESGVDTQIGCVAWTEYDSCLISDAITAIKEALAQPAQEPVAFYNPQHGGFYWAKPTTIYAPQAVDIVPLALYTTPPAAQPEQELAEDVVAYHSDGTRTVRIAPQRPWVGLTDGDIAYAYTLEKKFAMQYVDAKLKEKNT